MTATKLSKEQKAQIKELDKLKEDGVLDQDEYDEAVANVASGEAETADDAFKQQQAAAAAAQSPAEAQVVPEVRPQAAISNAPGAGVSEASKRIDDPGNEPMGADAYERANSDEQKEKAASESRMPNLGEGQRVQIIDGPEDGRMAYILQVHYTDGIQDMIAKSGTAEARFANVDHYVLRTRDGRSDLLQVTPDQVKPLDDIQGWGRGQI